MTSTPEESPVELRAEGTEEFFEVPQVIAYDTVFKVNAGAALVYAIYHHPAAMKLLTSDFWTMGFQKAYSQACVAYGVGAGSATASAPLGEEGSDR